MENFLTRVLWRIEIPMNLLLQLDCFAFYFELLSMKMWFMKKLLILNHF